MKEFINNYFNIIHEDSGIKVLSLPREIKYFNFKSFPPFSYKNTSVFQSSLNTDIQHVIHQLNERSNNKYTLNDIFIIVKRGIDEFNKLKATMKFHSKQSFNIISKSYKEIKVACAIEKNTILDQLIYLNENDDNPLYHNEYFCFIYTVLEHNMKKHDIDKNLFVENINNDAITLYVD